MSPVSFFFPGVFPLRDIPWEPETEDVGPNERHIVELCGGDKGLPVEFIYCQRLRGNSLECVRSGNLERLFSHVW